jgi:hypothetical protein
MYVPCHVHLEGVVEVDEGKHQKRLEWQGRNRQHLLHGARSLQSNVIGNAKAEIVLRLKYESVAEEDAVTGRGQHLRTVVNSEMAK